MRKYLFCIVFAMFLGGCVAVPESVQLPESTPLLSYQDVVSSPQVSSSTSAPPTSENTTNKMARWGGVVANIENKADKTQLDIVYYPLRDYGRPVVGKESIGRFRVYVDGFLDPMVYQRGRSMTFTGEFAGLEEGLVGEHVYQYPTLMAKGYHLWKDIDRIEIETISVWPFYHYARPFGLRGRYGWHGWPHYSTRHVITRKHNHHRDYGNNNNNGSSGSSNNNAAGGNNTATPAAKETVRSIRNPVGKQEP